MKKRVSTEDFLANYIKAMKKKLTLVQFAESMGITYSAVMAAKQRVATITGKKLPPLARQKRVVDISKIVKLVDDSHSEHKRLVTTGSKD